MISSYLGKICVYFSELLGLKCDENSAFFFKITQMKKEFLFFENDTFRYVMIGGSPYVSNENLDKVYSNILTSCNPSNRTNT